MDRRTQTDDEATPGQRAPGFPWVDITVRMYLDAEPEVIDAGGLADWLVARTLDRAGYLLDVDAWTTFEVEEEEE